MNGIFEASFALLLAASGPATPPGGAICAGIKGGVEGSVAGDRRFSRRALQMVEAALVQDEETLRAAVAPDAEFMLWRGDNSTSARERGSAGAVEFVRDLRPKRYQLVSVHEGPISRLVGDCEWQMTILFRTADPVLFKFRRGLIVSATGSAVAIVEGDVRTPPGADVRPGPTE